MLIKSKTAGRNLSRVEAHEMSERGLTPQYRTRLKQSVGFSHIKSGTNLSIFGEKK